MQAVDTSTFSILAGLIHGEKCSEAELAMPPFEQLRKALASPRCGVMDRAVLVRQALRWQTLHEPTGGPAFLDVPATASWPTTAQWRQVHVTAETTPDGYRIFAAPWRPGWLPGTDKYAVDDDAVAARQRRLTDTVPGDPFLPARFKRDKYQSSGQRAATRAALTMPPGATLLVCLPTGDGKSFVFQTVAAFDFEGRSNAEGVTLVVTPTVALALDHERSARNWGFSAIPRAYVGGNQEREVIIERIRDGSQGLCFASPEAICGRLREPLSQAAQSGFLRALVIDEAHLVDVWGANFRPEFQLLSGMRHDLLRSCGDQPQFRTLLLSATVTETAERALSRLFGTTPEGQPGLYGIAAAPRLRPEIAYWVAPQCEEEERQQRVVEAVCAVPRPAILYTTEVKHALRWHETLRQMGFARIDCLTGETPEQQRRRIIEDWHTGEIDLVVATSAFGLGIDNAHVRAVIHACIPETLDRFYQEVGRGGRDGCASLSLLIPTFDDKKTASGLNDPHYIGIDRGQQRWEAMFRHPDRRQQADDVFTLRVDIPPGYTEGDIDMDSKQNTLWNLRTLNMMASANLIALQDVGAEPLREIDAENAPFHLYQAVKILDPSHLDSATWETRITPWRDAQKQAARDNLRQMRRFLRGQACAAELLAPQYEYTASTGQSIMVARACGGCPACRQQRREPLARHEHPTPYPWPATQQSPPIVDENNRLLCYYLPPADSVSQRHFKKAIAALLERNHIRNLIVITGQLQQSADWFDTTELQRDYLHRWPIFVASRQLMAELPPGPRVIVALPGAELKPDTFRVAPARFPSIYIVPDGYLDPRRPSTPLHESYQGKEWSWSRMRQELSL
jgi:ATP-dependent DNA helicase RecQ